MLSTGKVGFRKIFQKGIVGSIFRDQYMYGGKKNGIYIYVRLEGGLGSEKIWGATVDKWEGKIGAKFLS